jgi:hypothetical protein
MRPSGQGKAVGVQARDSVRASSVTSRCWQTDRWLVAGRVAGVALTCLALRFGADAGVTLDERQQLDYANRVLAWFATGFDDLSALNYKRLWLYGGLFEVPVQWLATHCDRGIYETRHVLTALAGLLGVVATWKIADRISGARAGFIAATLLALTPGWIGHALFNPKDIPFGVAAAFACYAFTRIALAEDVLGWGDAVRAGFAIGAALGVRPGGMFLFGPLLLVVCARVVLAASAQTRLHRGRVLVRMLPRVGVRLASTVAIAWTLMVIAWPWAQLSPLVRPLQAAAIATHYPYAGNMLFDGQFVSSQELPARYLPTWFAISLPETYFLALSAGLVALALKRRHWLAERRRGLALVLLLFSTLSPVVGVIAARSVLYDGYRHMLFVLPPLAALSGVGLSQFLSQTRVWPRARVAVASAFISLAALTSLDIVRLHPYEYIYFNRSFGGLRAAAERFETDYWGASYKEGLSWLVSHVHPRKGERIRFALCNDAFPLDYYLERWGLAEQFELVPKSSDADYFLTTTRNHCERSVRGDVAHLVERDDVALLYVLQLRAPPRRR